MTEDTYDPIHAAMLAAGQDWTASDLLWSGFSPIGFGTTGGNGVPPGRRMSDDMPERIGKHRAFIAECEEWLRVKRLAASVTPIVFRSFIEGMKSERTNHSGRGNQGR